MLRLIIHLYLDVCVCGGGGGGDRVVQPPRGDPWSLG